MIKNLRLLREKHGISQQKLADAIGLTQQSINKYENHKIEPDITTLIQIADYFHTSVDFLIGHADAQAEADGIPVYRLSAEEVRMIEQYRRLSLKEKDSILLILDNYCK